MVAFVNSVSAWLIEFVLLQKKKKNNPRKRNQPCHLQTWRRYILPFLTIWHHDLFHSCLLTVFAFDWSPLTVCLQQCEFAESQRWNRANTSSFFVILGKVLMHWAHFSLFSIFLWLSYMSFCTFVHFKGEKTPQPCWRRSFILWNTNEEEGVMEFLTCLV